MAVENALPLTYGKFELRGIVGGCASENFCKEIKTKTGKIMKKLRFYVQTSELNRVYVELTGMERDTVRFVHFDGATKKSTSKEVPWSTRKTFKENGFRLQGVCLGLERGQDGKNEVRYMVELDAIEYMTKYLKDDMTVFCRGSLNYSSNGDRLFTALNISQISLCSVANELDSESIKDVGKGDVKETNNFNQTIVIQSVEKEGKGFQIGGLVLTSKGAESVSYTTYNEKLALNLKKLPPYTSILVSGHITQPLVVVEDEDDGWGEGDVLAAKQSFETVFLVTGANKDTIDKETYNEENVGRYIASKKEFGAASSAIETVKAQLAVDSDPWGNDDDWA